MRSSVIVFGPDGVYDDQTGEPVIVRKLTAEEAARAAELIGEIRCAVCGGSMHLWGCPA